MITSWESNRDKPNPYFNPSSGTLCCSFTITPLNQHRPSEMEIRRCLTLDEEKDELASTMIDADDDFTETKYLLYGLDLEDQQ